MAFDANQFMYNPLTQMGLGILGANAPGTSFGQAVGGGLLGGMQNLQRMKQRQFENQMAQARMAQEQAAAESAEAERQQEIAQQLARQRWQEKYGFETGMPEWAMKDVWGSQFATPDQTSLMQNLAAAGLQPGTPEYQDAMMQAVLRPPVSIQNLPAPPSGYAWRDPTNPQTGLEPIRGGPAEKPTEGQLTAAGFADRMVDSLKEITEKEQAGFNPAAIAERAPAALSNYFASPEYQTYKAAQEDWIRAKLRKESGAVIGEEEMQREIETYFPQPGDSEAVRRRKAKQRATATRSIIRAAGPQYERQMAKPGQGWKIEKVN